MYNKMKKLILTFCAAASLAVLPTVSHAAETSNGGQAFERIIYMKWFMPQVELKLIQNNKQELGEKKQLYVDKEETDNQQEKVELAEQPVEKTEVAEPSKEQSAVEKEEAVTPSTSKEQDVKPSTVEQTVTKTEAVEKQPVKAEQQSLSEVDEMEQAVVELTNKEREKAGLAPLQVDSALMAAAREKSQDMKDKNYFSHTSPTFGSPFDRLKALGISYQAAGENIAKGQKTAQEVVTAWMNSEGHRANILDEKFTHIGVGFVKDGSIWTQQFIKK